MLHSRLPRRLPGLRASATIVVLAHLLSACERPRAPGASGTSADAEDTSGIEEPPAPTGWRAEAGPLLLVAWPSVDEGSVVSPQEQGEVEEGVDVADTAAFERATFTLVDRDGQRHTARFGGWVNVSGYSGCSPWPVAQLVDQSGRAPSWTVGFAGAAPQAVPLDSLSGIGARDSARVTAEVSRLASVVRRPVNPAFQALPFVVQQVHRFEAAPGVQALAATTVRRMAQEASPHEERTFLVAERDSGDASGAYHVVYDERVAGPEETIESVEVLAAIRHSPSTPLALVLARDYGSTRGFAMLERTEARRWRVRWTSARMRCE